MYIVTLFILIFHIHIAYSIYNKGVICVLDKGKPPVCNVVKPAVRRNTQLNIPSHDPYLPTIKNAKFFNCTNEECVEVKVKSMIQIIVPDLNMKMCYSQTGQKYECEPVRYLHYKDVDKLLFLEQNIPGKHYFIVDCLAYKDGGRVCHKKTEGDSHKSLVNTGIIVRPNETNVLSQDEFICEEGDSKSVLCDINQYVPYGKALSKKDALALDTKILLKVDGNLVILKYGCIASWCGYSGNFKYKLKTRRDGDIPYHHRVYRCFYAKKQQICKLVRSFKKVDTPFS